jgi:hypothetical protein
VWWLALFGVWLLLVPQRSVAEIVAGAVVAALATLLAEAAQDIGLIHLRPRLHWLRELPRLPISVLRDCGKLAGALERQVFGGRPVVGRFRRVRFESGGDEPHEAARRALETFRVSLPPNSYVVGIDPEANLMLIHELVPTGEGSDDAA